MSYEIEAQILNIDYDNILEKINKMGAKQVNDWVKFKIAVFFPCLSESDMNDKYSMIFTRVRDEGLGKVTLTTKTKPKSKEENKYPKEYEISTTNTFEETRDLLLANHLTMKAYQERLRQKWVIPNRPEIHEIVFDMWPGLPLYMEVEASSEKDLLNFLTELGLDKSSMRTSGASMFYNEILGVEPDVINNKTKVLDFKTVGKVLEPSVTKKTEFKKILEQQGELLTRFGFGNLLSRSTNKLNRKIIRKASRKSKINSKSKKKYSKKR